VVTQGQLSDNARIFARDHGIVVMQAEALAQMLLNTR
jgi:restriction system protein